ncbi:MAG: hypothetical protein ABIK39_04495 [candidate division WOR-3 bacterium]
MWLNVREYLTREAGTIRVRIGLGSVLVAIGFILTIAGIWGCGRMPPAEPWQPTAADSAGIDSVVKAYKQLLKLDFPELGFQFLKWTVPDTILKKAISDNPFRQKYRCDSLQHIFSAESLQFFKFSFVATLDTAEQETTATVTVVETIPGILRLHAFQYTRFLRDSIIITPGETLRLKFYDSVFTDTSMIVEKPMQGVVNGGCVLRKEDGEWRFWKWDGGQRFSAPTPEDAPYLLAADIKDGVKTTRYYLRPDTTQFGVQRFYGTGELLSYKAGDSLWVTPVNVLTTDPNHFYFFFFKGIRYPMGDTNKIRFGLPDTGVQRLFIEKIPYEVFYDAGGELNAAGWGIPIYIQGGGQ